MATDPLHPVEACLACGFEVQSLVTRTATDEIGADLLDEDGALVTYVDVDFAANFAAMTTHQEKCRRLPKFLREEAASAAAVEAATVAETERLAAELDLDRRYKEAFIKSVEATS